jgi:hypothetical protein
MKLDRSSQLKQKPPVDRKPTSAPSPACGPTHFIVSADTFADARAAAIYRDIDLREIRRLDLPVCDLVVAVGPTGRPATPSELSELAKSDIIPWTMQTR